MNQLAFVAMWYYHSAIKGQGALNKQERLTLLKIAILRCALI